MHLCFGENTQKLQFLQNEVQTLSSNFQGPPWPWSSFLLTLTSHAAPDLSLTLIWPLSLHTTGRISTCFLKESYFSHLLTLAHGFSVLDTHPSLPQHRSLPPSWVSGISPTHPLQLEQHSLSETNVSEQQCPVPSLLWPPSLSMDCSPTSTARPEGFTMEEPTSGSSVKEADTRYSAKGTNIV